MSEGCEHDHGHHHHNHEGIKFSKKFIFSTRSINTELPINIWIMSTFSKIDKQDVKNQRTSYCIIFQKSEVAKEGQSLTWRYTSKELRDLDYQDLRNLIARDV